MKYSEKLKIAREWARSNGGILKKQNATINGIQAYMISGTDFRNWTLDGIVSKYMEFLKSNKKR